MTSSALPSSAQTATRPAWAAVILTLRLARSCAWVRATFHSRTSSIAPVGECAQAMSLKMRMSSPPVVSGPVSATE